LGKREVFEFAAIFGEWTRIVGQTLAGVSAPIRLSGKTLYLEVAEPVWADSMGYMRKEIIEKVNRMLGRGAVSKIRMTVRMGGRPKPGSGEREPLAEVPESAVREVEEAVKFIPDSQLRSAFKRIILKDIALKYFLKDKKSKP